MTHFIHREKPTSLDYLFCTMVDSGDIEGVIPKPGEGDSAEFLILGEDFTGKVQVSEKGVGRLTLASKYEDEEMFDTAHHIYDILPVHYGITLRDIGDAFSIEIKPIEKDA